MSVKKLGIILIVLCLYSCKNTNKQIESVITSKKPIVDGWYDSSVVRMEKNT